jgi:transposase
MIKCSRREGGHDIPSAINFPGYRQGHDLFSDLAGSGEQSAHLPVATRPSLPHGRLVTLIRGSLTGPNPVDRGKPGSKIHVLSDRRGLPLSVAVSAANTHDSQALKPLVMAIPATRSRRGRRRRRPDKLHADKAYDSRDLRDWVRDRGIGVRIARKGVESGEKLGRHRWVIERTIAWLFGYRRLGIRYERNGNHFCAFLTLAAALACYKKLPT